MGQAAYCAASLSLKYSYMDLILAMFELTLKQGGVLITAQHVKQVAAEAKKLIALRNTAGKAFNMASWAVAMHHMMEFRLKKEFGNEIGLQKYFAWKRTWHTETGKQSPSCKPKGSEEYEDWFEKTIEANPACQPDG